MATHAHDKKNEDHNHYLIPFLLILIFAIVEALGGWWTGSLALLSDAAHMFTDVAALGLAWLSTVVANKPNARKHASGVSYAELTVSIINATTMLVVIIFVIYEAIARYKQPQEVQGLEVMVIAVFGLLVNLIVAKLLHQSHQHDDSLNKRAAFLHVMGDLLGSVTDIAAGLINYLTGWMQIDPILSLLISILLLVFTVKLIRDIWQTLQRKQDHIHHPETLHDHTH